MEHCYISVSANWTKKNAYYLRLEKKVVHMIEMEDWALNSWKCCFRNCFYSPFLTNCLRLRTDEFKALDFRITEHPMSVSVLLGA